MDIIRILVVDDQTLVREGLAALLALLPDMEVVGQAADGGEALALAAQKQPDVVLMDVRMPGMSGVAATRQIVARCPETRVIVLTTFDNDEYVFDSLRAGASGYLLKNAQMDLLAAAIRTVHAGDAILDPSVTQKVMQRAARTEGAPELSERLTHRERDVLSWMSQGAPNAEIAGQLCLSEGTVKNYVSHVIAKLGARDRAHAVRLGLEWGLLDE